MSGFLGRSECQTLLIFWSLAWALRHGCLLAGLRMPPKPTDAEIQDLLEDVFDQPSVARNEGEGLSKESSEGGLQKEASGMLAQGAWACEELRRVSLYFP